MDSTFFERFSALCKEKGETPNSVARYIGASSGSVTAWKRGAAPRNATLTKIADYFGVTTDYLLGQDTDAYAVSAEDIKFALFGGDSEITDAMYNEVLSFAAFVKHREEKRKRKE